MPERNTKVQDRIQEELQKNPSASTRDLQSIAQEVDSSVAELSLRQFNAGYVLPLKRRGGGKSAKKGKAAGSGGSGARKPRGRKAAAAAEPAREAARRRTKAAPAPTGEREQVRATLMEFARDLSAAENTSAVVAVLSNVDRYVNRIVGSRA